MILLHLDQYLHSGNQNIFSGPDHNVQTLTLIFGLNARHRVIVQYFDVSILLEGKFLLKRMKELPEMKLLAIIIFCIVNVFRENGSNKSNDPYEKENQKIPHRRHLIELV